MEQHIVRLSPVTSYGLITKHRNNSWWTEGFHSYLQIFPNLFPFFLNNELTLCINEKTKLLKNDVGGIECILMLIDIINKGSMPDSSSTTYPTWASLSDILFSFVLEKYIVCDVCGLRSPHLSLVVSYILHLLYLFHARLDIRRIATKIAKILFSM